MDALTPILTYSFHTIKKINNFRYHLYTGDIWKPDREIFIIGADMGLLCHTNNMFELYLSISKVPLKKETTRGYFTCLKKDFIFYAQRDQRFPPIGINDLTKSIFFPSGTGVLVLKGEPIYFKCGAMNKSGRTVYYDIFATIYYTEIMSTIYRPQPREDPIDVQ